MNCTRHYDHPIWENRSFSSIKLYAISRHIYKTRVTKTPQGKFIQSRHYNKLISRCSQKHPPYITDTYTLALVSCEDRYAFSRFYSRMHFSYVPRDFGTCELNPPIEDVANGSAIAGVTALCKNSLLNVSSTHHETVPTKRKWSPLPIAGMSDLTSFVLRHLAHHTRGF